MTFLKHALTLFLIAGAILTTGLTAAVDNPLVIEGVPLRITVYDDSTMHVENSLCGGDQYNENSKGSILLLYDCKLRKWGGGHNTFVLYNDVEPLRFVPVSNTLVNPFTISTVYLAGADNDVRVTQTVSYTNGTPFYKIVWEVVNNGTKAYTDLRFRHGGDTSFMGDEPSIGNWDPVMKMVQVTKSGSPGYMGLYGAFGAYGEDPSPADKFAEFYPANVESYMKSRFYLNSLYRDVEHDAAYALEWLKGSLAPGETWTVTAFERWNCGPGGGGSLEVIPGNGEGCGPTQVSFEVRNWGLVEDTYDLTVNSLNGWPFTLLGDTSITVAPGDSEIVTVELTVQGSVGSHDVLTLTATSQSDPTLTNSGSADITSTCGCTAGNKALIDFPNGGETFNLGDEITIRWTNGPGPLGRLRLSLWTAVGEEGEEVIGEKFGRIEPDNIIAVGEGQEQTHTWVASVAGMKDIVPGKYFFKIREKLTGCWDASDAAFTISSGGCQQGAKAIIVYPDDNGVETFNLGDEIPITWRNGPGPLGRLRLSLWYSVNGELGEQVGRIEPDNIIAVGEGQEQTHTWDTSTVGLQDVEPGTYFIKIREKLTGCWDISREITIVDPGTGNACQRGEKAIIVYPDDNGTETFNLGETIPITWRNGPGPLGRLRLSLWYSVNGELGEQVGRIEPDNIIAVGEGQEQTQPWVVSTVGLQDVEPGTYFIKIREKETGCWDISREITINDPGPGGGCQGGEKAIIDYPNNGETFNLGDTMIIRWTNGPGPLGRLRLSLWTVVGGEGEEVPGEQFGRIEPDNIIAVGEGQEQTHTWVVSTVGLKDVVPGRYFVKIREKDTGCWDISDQPITIE